MFGQPSPVFIDPPYYDDGGLRRITATAKPAAMWSLNATTVLDPNLGFTQKPFANFKDSYELSVPGGVGTNWIDSKVQDGYVVMLVPPDPKNLGPNLDFIITKDPVAVKTAAASFNPVGAVILDGPPAVIQAAKGQSPSVPGIPGTGGQCPPGTIGIPPACFPVPGGGGQQPTPPFVPPLPGGGGQPTPPPVPGGGGGGQPTPGGSPQLPGLPQLPGGGQGPVVPPPEPGGPGGGEQPAPSPVPGGSNGEKPEKTQTAGMGGSGWVLPALVVIGSISLISLSAASKKKR